MPALVALTASTQVIDGLPRVRLNQAYVRAIEAAGLVPLVVPPLQPSSAAAVLDGVRGLVLTGGEDIDPAFYGQARAPETHAPHTARDACEIALFRAARERRMPTLAICRGIQVANVALGGTLLQDIAAGRRDALDHALSAKRGERVHDVRVDGSSRLGAILGDDCVAVNSSHHQALDQVADGVSVTACASDGIIEGAEWTGDDWWMVGVQWHPEELVDDAQPWDRRLFAAFADAVRAADR